MCILNAHVYIAVCKELVVEKKLMKAQFSRVCVVEIRYSMIMYIPARQGLCVFQS